MSAIKSALKAIRGTGEFEKVYDQLHEIYSSLLMYPSKYQMQPALKAVVPALKELGKREAEKNRKKLEYLNLIFMALAAWDEQSYYKAFDIESKIKEMNATNKGETVEKARTLLRSIVREMKIKFEAEHHLMNLRMRQVQGLGTPGEEAAKNEMFTAAGVSRGTPMSFNNRKRLSTVMARKQLGLPLNGSANAGLENVVRDKASLLIARMMPSPPTTIPGSIKGGRKTRRNRKASRRTRKH